MKPEDIEFYKRVAREGKCVGADPLLFDTGEGHTDEAIANVYRAKRICAACPMVRECLDFAIKNKQNNIWGGSTEGERSYLRRYERKITEFISLLQLRNGDHHISPRPQGSRAKKKVA